MALMSNVQRVLNWNLRDTTACPYPRVIGGGLQKQLRPWMAECPVLHAPDDLHFTADTSPQLLPLLGDVMR